MVDDGSPTEGVSRFRIFYATGEGATPSIESSQSSARRRLRRRQRLELVEHTRHDKKSVIDIIRFRYRLRHAPTSTFKVE